ncbi:MAG: VIT1/CCC1 transporter family protein [Ferruginibacter sp.]
MSLSENKQPSATGVQHWKQAVVGIGDGLIISVAVATALALVLQQNEPVYYYTGALALLGMIVMGLGGYYAAKFRMESLTLKTTEEEKKYNEAETKKTIALFKRLNLGNDMQEQAAHEIEKDSTEWKEFLQKNEQPFELPDKKQLPFTGIIIGLSYFCGALIPLLAYMCIEETNTALRWSVASTLIALPVVGYIKSRINGEPLLWGALRLLLLGAAAIAGTWLVAGIFTR